jgi:type I restriction enzyme S subunit
MASEPLLYGFLFADCPSTWEVVPFSDAVDFQEGPGILAKDFHESGVPLLRLSGVQRSLATLDGCNFLDPERVSAKWNHFRLRRGDMVISTSASIGMVSEIGDEVEGAVAYTGLIRLRPNRPDVWPGFIKQFARSSLFKTQAEGMAAGSVLRHFGPTHLRQMCFPVPPLAEQKRIAHILGTLDDKIELNRRMNATLEAMSRAIFKSWFVDFDPVRQKAAGKQPVGMDAKTAALFPDAFEDSEIGEVPKGWGVVPLDEIADYLNGLALQKYPAGDGPTLPVIKIAQLRKGDATDADRCNDAVPAEYVVEDGDVLFSWSGSLEVVIWCGGRGALNQHLFKVTSQSYPKWFYHLWTLHHLADFRLIAADKATTMGHIQRKHLSAAKVVVPPAGCIEGMTRTMEPLLLQSVSTRKESRTLAALRDTLLPKLLSGEIRVPEAEEAVEEADVSG